MKNLLVASCLLALAAATPGHLGLAYGAIPVGGSIISQYHAQDELGQYAYGYSGGPSAKHEARTLDGVTRGGYSYLDSYGLVQSASYVSDPLNGFRVAATNLPVAPSEAAHVAVYGAPLPVGDAPDVAVAKLAHFQAHADHIAKLGRKKRSVAYLAAPRSFAYSTVAAHGVPAVYAAAPLAAPLAAAVGVAGSSQYHAQDELGQYSYGYSNINSAKHESRAFDGTTLGGYSYVDGHGLVQSVNYHADGLGFRAVGTNFPVGP